MQAIIPGSNTPQTNINNSVQQVLAGNVSPGNGLTFDANGEPLTFQSDNTVGLIIRIGSVSNPNGLPANWTANNTNLTIAHNLNKVPYGIILIYATTAAVVYFGSIAATKTQITLKTTDDTTDTVIWILC